MIDVGDGVVIERYDYIRYGDPADAYRPYDGRYPEVAQPVADLIRDRMPGVDIEHIGSAAVPGCPGKGVVDLMLPHAPGELEAARRVVEGLGFRRDVGRDPFPPARPVYVGTVEHGGEPFRLHLHLVPAADPALVAAYAERKRAVLAIGVADGTDYNGGKAAFIQAVLGEDRPVQVASGEDGGNLRARRRS